MADLDPSHHIFRYVGGASIDGDFIEPAAFRRKVKDGKLEEGLSVNWVEYFKKATPKKLSSIRFLPNIHNLSYTPHIGPLPSRATGA